MTPLEMRVASAARFLEVKRNHLAADIQNALDANNPAALATLLMEAIPSIQRVLELENVLEGLEEAQGFQEGA